MKKQLTATDAFKILNMTSDNGGRVTPSTATPPIVVEYLSKYRVPSRAYPYSYLSAVCTQKFAKHLKIAAPDIAVQAGLAL